MVTSSKLHVRQRALLSRRDLWTEMLNRWRVPWGIVLVAVLTCCVYGPALHGGLILDDELLTQNKLVKAPDGLHRFWFTTEPTDYWPVTSSAFWIEWRLWGGNSTGYHLTNLVFHAIDALLVWLILEHLAIPGAFSAAVIFTVHPVNVESVAWISQLKNLLALLFALLAAWCYLITEVRLSPATENRSQASAAPWYLLSLLLFVLGMLSKGSVAVLPALLLLIVWWRRPISRWDIARVAPFFLFGGLLALLNVWFQTHGAETVVRNMTPIGRLLGAGAVVWFYLFKALLPIHLVFVYPQWNIDAGNLIWWLPLLSAVMVTALLMWLRQTRFGRPVLVAWLYFCISLVPVMGFTDVGYMQYSLVADHYQHIAIIGVIALVAAALASWRESKQGTARYVVDFVAAVYVGGLTLLANQQCQEYRDPVTLYETTLEQNPTCWLAHNNLGNLLNDAGEKLEAIAHFEASLTIKADQPKVYSNLGAAQVEIGQPDQGFDSFQQALKIDPKFADAEYNWGVALRKMGNFPEAIEHFQRAVALKQDNAQHYNNLGQVLLETGQFDAAIKNLEIARSLDPDDVNSCTALALAYEHAGRLEDARATAERGLELARGQRQTALADQIQAWLSKLGARSSSVPSGRAP
jgi:protein O-mannosyl-transferase